MTLLIGYMNIRLLIFSTITGLYHPSIKRLTGNLLLGRALEVTNAAGGLAKEIEKLGKLAAQDLKGRAYSSFGFQPNLLVTRPEDLAQIFLYNSDCVDRGQLLDTFAKIFGDKNLFTIPSNKEWRNKRAKLTEWILQGNGLANLISPMQKTVDEFIATMESEGHIASLEAFMASLTMEVFSQAGLASSLHGNASKIATGFNSALEVASLPMNAVWLRLDATLKYIGLSVSKHLDKERDQLQTILKEHFFDVNQENLLNKPNLLQDYFKQNPNDPAAVFKETIGDVGLLLLAGHETTSRLLQFAIISLAQHPAILEKLRMEIEINRPENNEWTYDGLKKMTYLEKIIKETLRLYPLLPIIPRMVTQSFILADIPVCSSKEEYKIAMQKRDTTKDVILHPGTGIMISPLITHTLPSIYKNPMKFDPDRYEKSSIDSNDTCTWIPFGIDNRKCPGRAFAVKEAQLFLLKLVDKFDFDLDCVGAKLLDTTVQGGTLRHPGRVTLDVRKRDEHVMRCIN